MHLLVSGVEHLTTGTLVFETEDGQRSALYLNRGVPTRFKAAAPVERLSAVLINLGWLEASQSEQSFERALASGRLHGEHLVQTGTLDAQTISSALRTQMLKKLLWANSLAPSTLYGLYEGRDFLSRWAGEGTPVSPMRAIWHLASNSSDSAFCAAIVNRLASQVLRIRADAVLDRFGFDSSERAVLDVLKAKPQTIDELTNLTILPLGAVHSLVYVLALTRQLDLGGAGGPLGIGINDEHICEVLTQRRTESHRPLVIGTRATTEPESALVAQPSAPAAPAPPTPDPAIMEKRRELLALAESEPNSDHYQLLGLTRGATPDDVQQAFFRMAKLLHPDRLGPELADLKGLASKLFGRLTQAQQCLSDQALRAEYDAQLGKGTANSDEEQERIHAVIQAVTSFQKAEVLFKKRMLAAAELEARHAHESDPDQADYLALLSWIQANKQDSEIRLPQILDQLNQALRIDPGSEKTHFYRAQVLSRLGRQRRRSPTIGS